MGFKKTFIQILALAAALPAGQAAFAGGVTDIPDRTGLDQLAPETSLFLLVDFKFPSDEKATVYRDSDDYVRVDYFRDGHRTTRNEVPIGGVYCAVMSHAGVLGYTESSKRLQVAATTAPNPVPREGERGVGIELRSIQSTKILSISCYQPDYASQPLTVQNLRQMIRMQENDSAIAFLGPPESGPVLAETVTPPRAPQIYKTFNNVAPAPEPVIARVPAAATARTYQSLDQTHRRYVQMLKKQAALSSEPSSRAQSP